MDNADRSITPLTLKFHTAVNPQSKKMLSSRSLLQTIYEPIMNSYVCCVPTNLDFEVFKERFPELIRGFDNPPADFVLVGAIAILFAVNPKIVKLRKDRDSNPGNLSVLRFSRPPQSTTLSPFQY